MNSDTIFKAGAILIKGRKFMLEQHGGNTTWIIPGGKLEGDETLEQALVRELYEEFRLNINKENLKKIGEFESQAVHNPDKKVKIIVFLVTQWEGDVLLHDGIERISWINSQNIDNLNISSITKEVIPLLRNMNLID